MKYFTIEELIKSPTAEKLKIDNTPSEDIKESLVWLIENVLDPLREAWGSPIHVNSCYRCKALNTAIKGSKTSQHCKGEAADIIPQNGDIKGFKLFCRNYFKYHDFDQLINETVGASEWIHVSGKKINNRRMFLKTTDCKTYHTWEQ